MSHPPHTDDTQATLCQELNEAQRSAALADDAPLLIVAGAGTGKTATLAHRVAVLIARGTDPGRILLLTFTRRAAREMTARAEALLRRPGRQGEPPQAISQRVWSGTFHSVAVRLLRLHAREIGLEPNFTILDRGDAADLLHVCRTQLGLGSRGKRFPQKATCLDIYSRCVNAAEPLSRVLAESFPWCRHAEKDLAALFAAYTDAKESQRVLDYDDLLLFLRGLLADEQAGARVRERFDHVLVDEYQDTNTIQADIIALLRPDSTGITAVGDDAQAIYSFRAATVRNILDFEARHPDARVLSLERNYRSTAPILDATNAVMEESTERREKTLWTQREGGGRPSLVSCADEPEQTSWLVQRILDHREQGTPLQQQAVLFRAQHHSLDLEMELTRRKVPFRKYGGLRFVETAHVKDLVAFLRLAANPFDSMAALRVLGLLPGVGPATAQRLADELVSCGGDFECWVSTGVAPATSGIWPHLVTTLRSLAASDRSVASQVGAVRAFYTPLLEQHYDYAEARSRDLEQIEGIAERCPDRATLLAELALDPPAYTQDLAGPPVLDEDWLVLSTMHSAKGLEFDVVYVIHAADGNIPSDMATGSAEQIDEERRLFYVACTRARNNLYVTHPVRYYTQPRGRSDTHGYAQRTRFISEHVLPHFVEEPAVPPAENAPPPTTTSDASVRVRDSVRRLWG